MSRNHKHFCWKCYGPGAKGQGRDGGWWKCPRPHCTMKPSTECKYHRELALRADQEGTER